VLRSRVLRVTDARAVGRTLPGDVVIRPAGPADLPALLTLLESAHLPVEGVAEWLEWFVVAESAGRLVGAAGLEVYGSEGLLRSVAVAADRRGQGLGGALTDEALAAAARAGIRTVYLLTNTAEQYFPRHGFRRITREQVSAAVQQSVEFRELCPASSAVMVKAVSAGSSSLDAEGATEPA